MSVEGFDESSRKRLRKAEMFIQHDGNVETKKVSSLFAAAAAAPCSVSIKRNLNFN
jgi:hypothetical protein